MASLNAGATGLVYRNPRPFNATYIVELEPNPATVDRAKDLRVWLPLPREWDSQKAVKIVSINPPPHATFVDPEFGNRMAFWDFGKEPASPMYLRAECLMLFGRPEVNRITQDFQHRFPINIKGSKFSWQGANYDQPTQGVIQTVDEGRTSKRLIILFAGLSAEATRNICDIQDLYLNLCSPTDVNSYAGMASYLIFDRDKRLLSGDWDQADPDLVWKF